MYGGFLFDLGSRVLMGTRFLEPLFLIFLSTILGTRFLGFLSFVEPRGFKKSPKFNPRLKMQLWEIVESKYRSID